MLKQCLKNIVEMHSKIKLSNQLQWLIIVTVLCTRPYIIGILIL